MKLKSPLAFSYGVIEIISKLYTTSHLERDLCISNSEVRQWVNKVSVLEWGHHPQSFVVITPRPEMTSSNTEKTFCCWSISGAAPGSESQSPDHWVLCVVGPDCSAPCHLWNLSGDSRKHSYSGAVFWPWPSPLPEHLLQVFWNAQEKIQLVVVIQRFFISRATKEVVI